MKVKILMIALVAGLVACQKTGIVSQKTTYELVGEAKVVPGNYGDVANMLKGVSVNDLRSYGASPADIAYITSRPDIAGLFTNQTATAATPSLNNVLSMIGK